MFLISKTQLIRVHESYAEFLKRLAKDLDKPVTQTTEILARLPNPQIIVLNKKTKKVKRPLIYI